MGSLVTTLLQIFTAKSRGERIVKIVPQLAKLKPNSIMLAGSKLVRSWSQTGSKLVVLRAQSFAPSCINLMDFPYSVFQIVSKISTIVSYLEIFIKTISQSFFLNSYAAFQHFRHCRQPSARI